ncbi:UNVERIFIED_CONTAM: Rad2 nuclease [Siphonaria sp. JEL0065]|nr:Rad2 nuclease [Siphonaria sp. JEL0065]
MKHHTERERRTRRKDAREKAHEELAKGNAAKATEMFQQCVDITPNMAWELMKVIGGVPYENQLCFVDERNQVLRKQGIEFIVAPYEADAQLVYLEKIKKVDAVLTEDSDLLVFGCQRLLLKLDANGNAIEICAKDFPHVPTMRRGWSFQKFRQACILSGCDYLPSLKGVGIKKAFDSMNNTTSAERLLKMWRNFGHSMKAPPFRENYDTDFKQAELTFLYQRVYDPDLRKLVHLNNPAEESENVAEMSGFLGPNLEPAVAEGVANGHLNPYTLAPYTKDENFSYDDSEIIAPVQGMNDVL